MDNITKEELSNIYYSNTNKEAMKILGVCQDTLVTMVKDAGLQPKGKAYGKRKYTIVNN